VSKIKRYTKGTRLFYGGGITTPEAAYDFAQYADTIVVGNVVYQQPELLKSIVEAAKA
jgi:putative glycerol-1-phosphate prenyltransferase